jgi:hypothetical protein
MAYLAVCEIPGSIRWITGIDEGCHESVEGIVGLVSSGYNGREVLRV